MTRILVIAAPLVVMLLVIIGVADVFPMIAIRAWYNILEEIDRSKAKRAKALEKIRGASVLPKD